MDSKTREFALFIDGIRIERGISRLDFIEDIVSLSQYKRYLRGVTAIPNDIVLELASRLKYSITDLYSLFTQKHSKEDSLIREVFEEIRMHNYNGAFEKLSELNPEQFVSEYYKTSYDFCMIHVQHKLGRVSDVHVLQLYSELINYPECLSNETFNFVEINTLTQIIIVSSKIDNFDAADRLYDLMMNGKLYSSTRHESSLVPILYYSIAQVFAIKEEYEKVIELTTSGSKAALFNETTNTLAQIFILEAYAYSKLENLEEAYTSAKKCFMLLLVSGNRNMFNSFKDYYDKVFDLPLDELLKSIDKMI